MKKTTAKKVATKPVTKPTGPQPCDDCLYHKAWYPAVTIEALMSQCRVCGAPSKPMKSFSDHMTTDAKKKDVEGMWHRMSNEARAAFAAEGLAPEGVLVSAPSKKADVKPSKPTSDGAAESTPKGNVAPRRPGVITRIIEVLKEASPKSPATKESILAALVVSFPDREQKAMRNTVSSQVPSALKAEKGIVVQTDGKGGFWLPK